MRCHAGKGKRKKSYKGERTASTVNDATKEKGLQGSKKSSRTRHLEAMTKKKINKSTATPGRDDRRIDCDGGGGQRGDKSFVAPIAHRACHTLDDVNPRQLINAPRRTTEMWNGAVDGRELSTTTTTTKTVTISQKVRRDRKLPVKLRLTKRLSTTPGGDNTNLFLNRRLVLLWACKFPREYEAQQGCKSCDDEGLRRG